MDRYFLPACKNAYTCQEITVNSYLLHKNEEDTPPVSSSKEREKLKYFEGVLRNVWVLRSVSYEIY